jgi:hypothetical protein
VARVRFDVVNDAPSKVACKFIGNRRMTRAMASVRDSQFIRFPGPSVHQHAMSFAPIMRRRWIGNEQRCFDGRVTRFRRALRSYPDRSAIVPRNGDILAD